MLNILNRVFTHFRAHRAFSAYRAFSRYRALSARRVLSALGGICLLCLSACSATGGAPRTAPSASIGSGQGSHADTPAAIVAMITHGAPGDTFWDLVRKGAEDAARKDNLELRYSSDPQAPNQATLISSAIDARVAGMAVTLPNAQALGPAAQRAVERGIPVVGLNAGMDDYQNYGLSGFFGQDESLAGRQAGARLARDGARRVLCVIHEQGNSSQEARCAGAREGLRESAPDATLEILYVNGTDLTAVTSTVQAKLAQDRSIDWVLSLVAPVALAASRASEHARGHAAHSTSDPAGEGAGDSAASMRIATFDTNAELISALKDGRVQWAVDQQPYLQGYLAIDALWLQLRNGSTLGGGAPVSTGPAFVDLSNLDRIEPAIRQGLR